MGYRLVLCGRNLETLNQTAAVAPGIVVRADVTKVGDDQTVIDRAMSDFGRVDLIVNNAGIAPVLGIEQMSVEQWHSVIDTNLSAAFYFSKAVWPIFRRQQGGVIVNISSLAARDPFPGFAAYGSAKAGLNLFGLSLAREGATMGVRVYTIAPGAVETGLFRSLMTVEQFPTERTLSPVDVAKVVAQCAAGDERFTSGEVIWMQK